MRLLLTVCFLGSLVNVGLSQSAAQDLFQTVKPEATITVERHRVGADLVKITLLDPEYPPDVLKSQILRLGSELKHDPQGVAVSRVNLTSRADGSFLDATFAIDGLEDAANGAYRLQPLARALTGGPKGHEIHGLMVVFAHMAPTPSTVQEYGLTPGAPVQVMGRYEPALGLEYRVALNTQDPARIVVPESIAAPAPASVLPTSSPSVPWLLYASAAMFALAIGALVYSLTLRNSRPRPPGPARKHPTGTFRQR